MHIEKKELIKKYNIPARPGKDGYYRIYVKDPTKKGGRKQLFGKTLEELESKLYAFEKGVTGSARHTFAEVYELFLEDKLKYVKAEEKRVSRQNTINKNRSDYKRYFAGTEFEQKYIDSISKNDVEGIMFFNLERYTMRDKAMSSLKGILRSTFNFAYEQYWIADNLYTRMNFNKFNGMLEQNVSNDKRVHSEFDLKRILRAIHEHQEEKPCYMPAYALEMQILIGCRRGELAPLRRSDVLPEGIWISREQISVKKFNNVPEHWKIVDHTKTYKDRLFPLTDSLREFLTRLYAVLDRYYPNSPYLFPDSTELGVINNNTVYRLYYRICKQLGIKISREEIKGTHSFRRNAITDVVNATGGNVILASQLFGNSPAVAAKNYYTGVDTGTALTALNKRKFS
ncbi:MAG: tyrosine-type recombinase/integrase [Lachnospiraceae bacterium]|nr:tyrosine-type recombinase/integrase [Lachnospiraceae bacterium]